MSQRFTLMTAALLAAALVSVDALAATASAGARSYEDLALNGAGDRVAALESVNPPDAAKRAHASVVVRDAGSGKVLATYDPCPHCLYNYPSWSPDGKALAFIGNDSHSGNAMLYLASDGKVRAISTFKGVANTARWAPDGQRLALLATVGARKSTGATQAGAPQVGEIGTDEDEQRIALVPRSGGALKLLSPEDTFVYEYDWMPDGSGWVVTSAKGNGDNNWWVATLGHVDAGSGALRVLAAPKTQLNMPRVSGDGKTVAYIGGLMSDFGSVGGDIFTVPLAGGEPVDLTPGFNGSFNGLDWRNGQLLATAQMGGEQAVLAVDAASGSRRVLWSQQPVSAPRAKAACPSVPTARAPPPRWKASSMRRISWPAVCPNWRRSRMTTTRCRPMSPCAASAGPTISSRSKAGCCRRSTSIPARPIRWR